MNYTELFKRAQKLKYFQDWLCYVYGIMQHKMDAKDLELMETYLKRMEAQNG